MLKMAALVFTSVGKGVAVGTRPVILPLVRIVSVSQRQYATGDEVRPISSVDPAALRRGRGGRSSFSGNVATVFGASGFLGRYVVNKLGKLGTQVIIPYRGDHYDVLRLKVCGDLGQILFSPFYLKDEESLRKCMKYSNVVINLIGQDFETRNFSFEDTLVTGARNIARIARECGVKKLVHVSSLNVAENAKGVIVKGGSKFLAAKWRSENAVREEFPGAIIFRPAEIYGSEDRFLRYYAHPLRREIRWMPLWNKGDGIIKQPVFVGDVAKGIMNALADPDAEGKTYQAVGPTRYELGELVDFFHRVMRKTLEDWGYRRVDMRFMPFFQLRVSLMQRFLPSRPILVWDKLEREHTTDKVYRRMPSLEDLGVSLTRIEQQALWELRPYRSGAYYEEQLGEFPDPAPPKVVA